MEHRPLVGAAVGWAVLFGVDWLIEGKSYSVSSILFGMDFALQTSRAKALGHDVGPFFRWRMAVLGNSRHGLIPRGASPPPA